MAQKAIIANRLIQAMQETGLLPELCTEFTLHARIGEVVRLEYKVIGDERLLDVAPAVEEADSDDAAGVAR